MKKFLKISLIILIIIISVILLDTLQARIFKRSPFISWKEQLEDDDSWVKKGIIIDTFYCTEEKDIQTIYWKFKHSKFSCPVDNSKDTFDLYLVKPQLHNDIKFNDYYKNDDQTIYLAGNIEEVYIVNNGNKVTLKNYVSLTYQTFDDSIKSIVNKLDKKDILKDGGTTIYKSKDKDITVIVCNTLEGNKDIFIGEYSMKYEQDMCK